VAVSRGPNLYDVLVRGTDNIPYRAWWDGKQWHNWEPLGPEKIQYSPGVAAQGQSRLDVFVHGSDNTLYTKSWNGSAWSGYVQLGQQQIASSPAAVSWGPNRLDVFVQGTDFFLYTKSWNGSTWSGYTEINPTSQIASSPAVVSWGPNRLDVFVRGMDSRLYTTSWNGSAWSGYAQLGTEEFASDPAAASQGPNLIDVFVLGTDGNFYKKSLSGGVWSNYESVGTPSYPQLPSLSQCIELNLDWYGFDLVLDEQCTKDLKGLVDTLLQFQIGTGLSSFFTSQARNIIMNAIKSANFFADLAKGVAGAVLTVVIALETDLLDKALASADSGNGVTLHFSVVPIGISLVEALGAFLFAFEQFAENLALAGNLIHVGLADPVTTVFWITGN
jgi:hypothetical protein